MRTWTIFATVGDRLEKEIAEDRGAIATSDRPACPKCQRPLEARFGRHAKRFSIIHAKSVCEYRFVTFAQGETEEEAWKNLDA